MSYSRLYVFSILFIAWRQKSRRDDTRVETLRFLTSLTSAPWGAQKIGLLNELPTYNPYRISPFGVKTESKHTLNTLQKSVATHVFRPVNTIFKFTIANQVIIKIITRLKLLAMRNLLLLTDLYHLFS